MYTYLLHPIIHQQTIAKKNVLVINHYRIKNHNSIYFIYFLRKFRKTKRLYGLHMAYVYRNHNLNAYRRLDPSKQGQEAWNNLWATAFRCSMTEPGVRRNNGVRSPNYTSSHLHPFQAAYYPPTKANPTHTTCHRLIVWDCVPHRVAEGRGEAKNWHRVAEGRGGPKSWTLTSEKLPGCPLLLFHGALARHAAQGRKTTADSFPGQWNTSVTSLGKWILGVHCRAHQQTVVRGKEASALHTLLHRIRRNHNCYIYWLLN